jgi:hypothetical protein
MADDHTQRPYPSNELPERGAPAAAPGANSASDPLAELARLIGQNDPFAEFGRDGARRGAAPQTAEPAAAQNFGASDYYDAPAAPAAHQAEAPPYAAPNTARQSYGSPPFAAGADLYHNEHEAPGYPAPAAQAGGYEGGPYYPNQMHPAGEEEDHYDDVPPPRRRMGIMAIAAVFALAVIGTAGAFGYRALFGSSGSSGPPPVIKADATPSKIVPTAKSKDQQSSKLSYDRVNERGQGEKLVSREEQPVEMKDKPAGVVLPRGQDVSQSGSIQPPMLGSGVVASEPKKIHTIAIHPDQATMGDSGPPAMASSAPAPARAPTRVTTVTPAKPPAPVQSPRDASMAAADPAPPPRQTAVAPAPPPARQAAAPASSNAPLSLSPDAPAAAAPARAAPQVMRTAAVAPPTQVAPTGNGNRSTGGYAVQVSSQRSEADAQAAFRSLQAKYPSQLGGRQPLIHRADLGAKGIYFRAMVGPFGNANEASELCSKLKAAGGQCIVQKN